MPKVIALTGKSGVGKDTMAKMLYLFYGYRRYAFADQLRRMALDINPLILVNDTTGDQYHLAEIVEALGWNDAKRIFPEIRELLRNLGEAAKTHIGPNVWVNSVINAIRLSEKAVVSDVRFWPEVNALRKVSCQMTLIRLTRSGVEDDQPDPEFSPDITFSLDPYPLGNMRQAADDLIAMVEEHHRRLAAGQPGDVLAYHTNNSNTAA